MGTHPIFESDFDCLTDDTRVGLSEFLKMTRYSVDPENAARSCKTKGSDLRVHFKNTHETAAAIKGMHLHKATAYLKAVIQHQRCIPFRRFCGGVGRTAQAKAFKNSSAQGRWPKKSCELLLGMLKNAESNAEVKGLDVDALVIDHIQVNAAAKQRRRTYRAHGRINPYMASPCHVEIMLSEHEVAVPRAAESAGPKKVSQKKLKKQRMMAAQSAGYE